ncbi:MAG: T9SS type A sorting domain-containing protein, partial [Candidatus Kryptonium sp.]
SDGKWHCVMIAVNQPGDVLKFYVDGDRVDEIFIPNLSQFEINRPSVKIEKGLIDEVLLSKSVKPEFAERLWRYFVKVDTDVVFFLKFENEEVNVIGSVNNIEMNAVKFVPSSAPIYSPGIKVTAELKEGKISISWEVKDPGFVARFILERKIKDEQFQPIYQTLASDLNKYTFVDLDVEDNSVYFYRVKRVNKDGSFEFSDEIKVGVGLKKDFEIIGNFPNPFNSETKIIYTLFNDTYVKLTVYDIVGREIAVLVDGFQNAGKHEVSFNLGNIKVDEITSGIYLYKLQTQRGYEIRKMVVIK